MFIAFIIIVQNWKHASMSHYYHCCHSCLLTPSVCKHFWAPANISEHLLSTSPGLTAETEASKKGLLVVYLVWGGVWGLGGSEALWRSDIEDLKSALTEEQVGSLVPSGALKCWGRKKWSDKQMSRALLACLSFCPFSTPASEPCISPTLHTRDHGSPFNPPPRHVQKAITTCE